MYRLSFDERSVTLARDASLRGRVKLLGVRGYLLLGGLLAFCAGSAAIGRSLDDPDSITPLIFYAPAALCVMWIVTIALLHMRMGFSTLTVRFAPEGITEQINGRTFSHPWSWLTRFRDDDARLDLELGTGGAKHRLLVDKRTNGPIAKRLLVLFATHAAEGAAQFARGARGPAVAPPARKKLHDLN